MFWQQSTKHKQGSCNQATAAHFPAIQQQSRQAMAQNIHGHCNPSTQFPQHRQATHLLLCGLQLHRQGHKTSHFFARSRYITTIFTLLHIKWTIVRMFRNMRTIVRMLTGSIKFSPQGCFNHSSDGLDRFLTKNWPQQTPTSPHILCSASE